MNWQWADVETERPVGGDCYDRTVLPHLARLTDVLKRGVVIGHNLAFDFDFLTYEIERLRKTADASGTALVHGMALRVRFVDTLGLARRLVDAPDYELGTLLERFGVRPDEPLHTALGDAFATRALFARLTDHPEISTLADAGLQKLAW
jgi:DNA polymerase III epsilon subunit-like protein